MKNKCIHEDCIKISKYGNYCFKHRNYYLLDEKSTIIMKKFTYKIDDYYKKDLKNLANNYIKTDGLSKLELFIEVKRHIDIYKIIKIQAYYRGKKIRERNCHNDKDFYTYEMLIDIPKEYFYSYVDLKNIKWGFDIRSLKKLIDMNNNNNPYTMEVIPKNIIDNVINKIKKYNIRDIEDIIFEDKKEILKHKIIDVCSSIERSGYTCLIEWIINLNHRQTKHFYRVFEDTINYRAQLTDEIKIRIYPPEGKFFETPIIEILHMNRNDIMMNILKEVEKFANCNDDSDRKLGYIYFIVSLSEVCRSCYETHKDWINFIN